MTSLLQHYSRPGRPGAEPGCAVFSNRCKIHGEHRQYSAVEHCIFIKMAAEARVSRTHVTSHLFGGPRSKYES